MTSDMMGNMVANEMIGAMTSMFENFAAIYLIGLIMLAAFRRILGAIAMRVSSNRGRKGGFWWGFCLGVVGIIVEAVRPIQ